jgi:four helix bundle protein
MQVARFAHSRLAAYQVVKEALVRGDALARRLPRGYAKLADQLRRALLGAFLQFVEGASREGADRRARLRCARAEAGEAAAALEAAHALGLAPAEESGQIIALLDRFAAMATGLGQLGSS